MHTRIVSALFLSLAVALSCGKSDGTWVTASPDGKVSLTVQAAKRSQLTYSISYDGKTAVEPSALGFTLEGVEYGMSPVLKKITENRVSDDYTLKAGKKLSVKNEYNEVTLSFSQKGACNFEVIARVYDDGAAFRYRITGKGGQPMTMDAEATEFSVPTNGKAWIHPYDWNSRFKPSYEQYCKNEIAINSKPSHDKGWAFPMLFNTNGLWMMITEAALDGTYPATHIDNSGKGGCYKIRFPEIEEPVIPDDPRPVSTLPWTTPWRAVIVGEGLGDIFKTQMVQNLNPPSQIADESWIKPGKAAWSWWYSGGSPRSYEAQIKYVDLCHEMNWEYSLLDSGWHQMDGEGVEGVVKYANKMGVGIWLWYHSGSGTDAESPAQQKIMIDPQTRRAEMERISKMGVKGIKVDFFDTDKQGVIAEYIPLLKDAAEFHLLVDLHGATLPRGFDRTWPNVMTTEAVRGAESLGRQERCDNAAEQNTVLPFTRNVVGSMDYTPVTFSDKIRQGVPAFRRTSVAHQLALAVVFESGFQCLADRAEAYLSLPDVPKEFLKKVPAAWDESQLLSGWPGTHAIIARRSGNTWYIGGINGKKEPLTMTLNLPEGCKGKTITLIGDGKDFNTFDCSSATAGDQLSVSMLGEGGFAAVIE